MPHCPRSLFDLLLARNWNKDRLSHVVLLGNRLDMYDDPTHPSASQQKGESTPYIKRGAPLFSICELPRDKRHVESFNDLALQWVPRARLEELPEEFWTGMGGEGEPPLREVASLEDALIDLKL